MLTRRPGLLAIAPLLAMAVSAGAQEDRPWVDPPAATEQRAAPQPPAPEPAPPPPAAPQAQAPAPEPAPPTRAAEPAQRPPAVQPDATGSTSSPAVAAPVEPPRAAPRPSLAAPAEPPRPRRDPEVAAPASPPSRPAAPRPETAEPAARPSGRATAALEGAARKLMTDYLDFWSSRNDVALQATPSFYGSQVEFHGRVVSARELYREKLRFVERWPQRDYAPRLDTTRTECNLAAEVCTIRTLFDFEAANPRRGRRSRGTASLSLVVSFAGGEPVIVSERSQVLQEGRRQPVGDVRNDG